MQRNTFLSYEHLNICYVRVTDNNNIRTMYGQSEALLNNKTRYWVRLSFPLKTNREPGFCMILFAGLTLFYASSIAAEKYILRVITFCVITFCVKRFITFCVKK